MSERENSTARTERWKIVMPFEATEAQAAQVARTVYRILRDAGVVIKPNADTVAIMENQHG